MTDESELTLIYYAKQAQSHSQKDKKVKQINNLTLTDVKLKQLFPLSPFINLEQIWLNRNQIESIECLARMDLPKMKKFSVSYNHITTMQSLRKANMPQIVQFQFDNNLFRTCENTYEFDYPGTPRIQVWFHFGGTGLEKQYMSKSVEKKMAKFYKQVVIER